VGSRGKRIRNLKPAWAKSSDLVSKKKGEKALGIMLHLFVCFCGAGDQSHDLLHEQEGIAPPLS
jgi:hypothetical protein